MQTPKVHEGDEKLVSRAIRTANKIGQAHTPSSLIPCTATPLDVYTTNLFTRPVTDDCPVIHTLPQLVTESKEGGEHSPPLTTECPWEDLVLFLFFVFLHVVSKVPEHTHNIK